MITLTGAAAEGPSLKSSCADAARAGVETGAITFKLTTPEELQRLLGEPSRQHKEKNGDVDTLALEYSDVTAMFGRFREFAGPFTLYRLQIAGKPIDIGQERRIVLRTTEDLNHLDSFWGLAGVSLTRLDLRGHLKLLNRMTFDNQTLWPTADKLPTGLNPERLLDEGKNPGLGVRGIHATGVNGQGVGIAIIDQPLLREHEEYKDRIVHYDEVDLDNNQASMHGPVVTSVAVGKTCGVAPRAAVYYFAAPSWKWLTNEPWAELLEHIVDLNQHLIDTPKIRIVSLSLGAFSQRPNYARWQQAVKKAEAANILVVTCDPEFLRLAILKRIESHPETTPSDYERGWISYPSAELYVPAANRTMASFRGTTAYTYDRTGGLSWTVPYLAGVAALGLQIDPQLKPAEIVRLWRETACQTDVGPVIDPVAFVRSVKQGKAKRG